MAISGISAAINTRSVGRYMAEQFPEPLNRNILSTSDSIKGEIVRSIKQFSDVDSAGKSILSGHGHKGMSKALPIFQSYLRQGLTFYEAADKLHQRASPLLYYYSFMNFAKAICFSRNPSFTSGRIHHGVSMESSGASVKKIFVKTVKSGVFPEFYKEIFGRHPEINQKIPLSKLFPYSSDLQWECVQLGYGRLSSIGCRYAIVCNIGEADFRGVIVVHGTPQVHPDIFKVISRKYVRFQPDQDYIRSVFNLTNAGSQGVSFWETKATYTDRPGMVLKVMSDLKSDFSGQFSCYPFDDPSLFQISKELVSPKRMPINEMNSIYLSMFALGNLVRYQPHTLEKMLKMQDSWMIENFINATPITFIRHIRNEISSEYLAFRTR